MKQVYRSEAGNSSRCGSDCSRAGSNGIDIEVSRHHLVSASSFQGIEVSTDDRMVCYSWIPGIIHPLNFLHGDSCAEYNR